MRSLQRSMELPDGVEDAYQIKKLLGSGAMGKVVLALDRQLEREVAIKFIRPGYVDSADACERFLQEARAMARVRSPHVVEIYALGGTGGLPYLVMEYIPGRTLEDRLIEQQGEPLPLDEAIDLLDQICRGVEAIHASGAVHRDLKPSNILLGPGGRVVVADLGLAHRTAGLPQGATAEVAGTPAYISPEVIARRSLPALLAPRADVYALGVIAYQLFTGRLPFDEEDLTTLLARHLSAAPPSLRHLRPGLPAHLERVVLGALIKDPVARMPSAEEMRRSLFEAREATPVSYRGVRVLVVDDEATSARMVARTLASGLPGAVVETASDGELALRSIDNYLPSLVVADLNMPRLNGVELVALMRGHERTRGVPVVVMTATGPSRDWRLIQRLGAEGFLVKPLDMEQMLTTVRSVLSRARLAGDAQATPRSVGPRPPAGRAR